MIEPHQFHVGPGDRKKERNEISQTSFIKDGKNASNSLPQIRVMKTAGINLTQSCLSATYPRPEGARDSGASGNDTVICLMLIFFVISIRCWGSNSSRHDGSGSKHREESRWDMGMRLFMNPSSLQPTYPIKIYHFLTIFAVALGPFSLRSPNWTWSVITLILIQWPFKNRHIACSRKPTSIRPIPIFLGKSRTKWKNTLNAFLIAVWRRSCPVNLRLAWWMPKMAPFEAMSSFLFDNLSKSP